MGSVLARIADRPLAQHALALMVTGDLVIGPDSSGSDMLTTLLRVAGLQRSTRLAVTTDRDDHVTH